MRSIGRFAKILWLLVVISLGSLSSAQSQDLFTQMNQVKGELSSLKNELNDLKRLVYSLRKAVLESATAQEPQEPEKMPPEEEKVVKQAVPVDEKELTRVICESVGKFFSEAEAVLRRNDPIGAEEGMREAFQKMTSALRGYAGTHRVSKILNIYEALAWDTFEAVRLRHSVQGNQEFLEALRQHKQKYLDTCPKD